MISISVDVVEAKRMMKGIGKEGRERTGALLAWAKEMARKAIEGLLRAELTVILEREADECGVDHRNGYRSRTLVLGTLGSLLLRIPRDRQGKYRTEFLPFRKRRSRELEELAAEMFLEGLSTRDVSRVLERHLGKKYDSKEISRMVEATSGALDAWLSRDLSGVKYRFLFLDGSNFNVRRNKVVEKIPFLAVMGVRAKDDRMEVLALTVGDKEQKSLWEELFRDMKRRGLDADGVELGIMDGLPGLESAFGAAFSQAQTQRCQVHAKGNAMKRVSKKDRKAFKADLDQVFYAPNEAQARKAYHKFVANWGRSYPTAVGVITRDLDSLLRFYQWEEKYWPSLRTTNPIERLNKEFKRRTKAMEIVGSEKTTYRLLAYVAMIMNENWRRYALSNPKHFYTLKAA
jgi:putative transposase